jgi:dCTP deaminase
MKLADSTIKQLLKRGTIKITPSPDLDKIQGVTVPLHLGNEFIDIKEMPDEIIYPEEPVTKTLFEKEICDVFYDLLPGSLTLAITNETVELHNNQILARLDGRSKLARLGISVHITAHRIDPGFSGKIVLEIFNCSKNTIRLKVGSEIGALLFEEITGRVEKPYIQKNNSYVNQSGVCL